MAINTSVKINAELRRSQALQLKQSGMTMDQIAERLQVSQPQIYKDIKRRLAEVRRDDSEAVQEAYALQVSRYERLLLRWWPEAIGRDDELAALATDKVLRILRQLDIIGGLIPDKPLIQLNTLQINSDGGGTLADLLSSMASDDGIVEGAVADDNASRE